MSSAGFIPKVQSFQINYRSVNVFDSLNQFILNGIGRVQAPEWYPVFASNTFNDRNANFSGTSFSACFL